ncbi:MAG TPA: transcription termination factor Rho [Acidimicrobiales bacterium]|nr:transcription termination factor Rho [Acidimicrobiales bacterium]
MTAEQQLERSVLEGKERDELHAIAQAMSLKTTTRTKKSDIIDRILEAAGVTGASNGTNGHKETAPAEEAASTNGASHADRPRRSTASQRAEETATTDGAAAGGGPGDGDGDGATAATGTGASDGTGTSTEPVEAPQAHDSGSGNGSGAGPRQSQSQSQSQRQQGRHQQPANAEPGNRRNRRRRGRERGTGGGSAGGERDLQGAPGQDAPYQGELVEVRGLLDLRDEGYGFVRCDGYLPSSKDVYVSISQARRFALRKGDYVEGACRPASSNEKYPALLRIDKVSGMELEAARQRPRFEDLTPLFPDEKLLLEMPGAKEEVTARIVDLLSPIGKGQRGLIVSPPKAGKTTVMKQIAHSIEANNPEVHLMVLLVDERPEEVTDMRRSVKGEVVASTFDRPSDEHTAVAELAIERAKRLVEQKRDVVIILDGITRLARAYNLAQPATGRIMSGGVDSGALYPPKRFFGAARNIEEGGSLTILATALVETGSKMDEVIFEEFKGTGNMELRLDRRLAERRLYPSIDVNASSTRHEELLFDRGQLQQVWKLRRVLNALANEGNAAAGLELLMDKLRTTKSNDEFLAEIAKGPTPGN